MTGRQEEHLWASSVAQLAASPTGWRRLLRRFRAWGIRDPLAQSILALGLALALWGVAILFVLAGQLFTAAPLILAGALPAAAYVTVVAVALRRDKTVQYWREARALERKMERERRHRVVLVSTMHRLRELELAESRATYDAGVQVLLADLVKGVFDVLSGNYGDVAVVLSVERDGWHRILRSTHSRGSCWNDLRSGKRCSSKQSVAERLSSLANHYCTTEVVLETGSVHLSVLSDIVLHERDEELVEQVSACLALLGPRWSMSVEPAPGAGRLHLVG